MGDHERGSKKGLFCGVPGTPCDCGNHYIKICEPGWGGHTFRRLVRASAGTSSFAKKYEAHHVLCVASVSEGIVAKTAIEGVVKETDWCINNKDNMIGLPLWGHSVKWYCDFALADAPQIAGQAAPAFANLPQHDWDHNCTGGYTHEINKALDGLAKQVESAGHEVKPANLKSALNAQSGKWNATLKARGARLGGTHAAWALGSASPDSKWYLPFSMASDGCATGRPMPRRFDVQLAKWIKRISEAITGG